MPDFGSQSPELWGWPRGARADIVPFVFDGHSFPMGVARLAAPVFHAVLAELVRVPGFKLRESRKLDAGMWGYADRRKGGGGGWSFHAYGLALDINAPDNPMSSRTPPASPYRLPLSTQVIARRHGCLWGGGPQGFGDWMHIEVHMSPEEIAGRTETPATAGGRRRPFPLPDGWYYGPYEGPKESISGLGAMDQPYRGGLFRAQTRLGVNSDGYYGPVTARAIRAFQQTHGLSADGLLGARTWAALGL